MAGVPRWEALGSPRGAVREMTGTEENPGHTREDGRKQGTQQEAAKCKERKKEGPTHQLRTKAVSVPRKGGPAEGSHKQVTPHHSCDLSPCSALQGHSATLIKQMCSFLSSHF